jgi:hypothetical protein
VQCITTGRPPHAPTATATPDHPVPSPSPAITAPATNEAPAPEPSAPIPAATITPTPQSELRTSVSQTLPPPSSVDLSGPLDEKAEGLAGSPASHGQVKMKTGNKEKMHKRVRTICHTYALVPLIIRRRGTRIPIRVTLKSTFTHRSLRYSTRLALSLTLLLKVKNRNSHRHIQILMKWKRQRSGP